MDNRRGQFFSEIRDIICNPKRQTAAARISRRGFGPMCAGLAVFIMGKFGLSEPIATVVAIYLLIVLLEATKGAFCKMTVEKVVGTLK